MGSTSRPRACPERQLLARGVRLRWVIFIDTYQKSERVSNWLRWKFKVRHIFLVLNTQVTFNASKTRASQLAKRILIYPLHTWALWATLDALLTHLSNATLLAWRADSLSRCIPIYARCQKPPLIFFVAKVAPNAARSVSENSISPDFAGY